MRKRRRQNNQAEYFYLDDIQYFCLINGKLSKALHHSFLRGGHAVENLIGPIVVHRDVADGQLADVVDDGVLSEDAQHLLFGHRRLARHGVHELRRVARVAARRVLGAVDGGQHLRRIRLPTVRFRGDPVDPTRQKKKNKTTYREEDQ